MTLEIETVRAFVRVAELASFSGAAEQLGIPKARISQQVQRLEEHVGARLLHRTTRAVKLTRDGDQFLGPAKTLLLEADELAAMFAGDRALDGRIRMDLPVGLARNVVIPRLPELLAVHRKLDIQLSSTDRIVDVIREGFDCVVRAAVLQDSGLIATRMGDLEMINCASAEYLRQHGRPTSLAELNTHTLVHYSGSMGADGPEFEYYDGTRYRAKAMRASLTVNNADAFAAACRAGLGIIQTPRTGVAQWLASGELEEVLPKLHASPLPVFLVHPHGRRPPKRVRIVLDWLASVLKPHLKNGPRAKS